MNDSGSYEEERSQRLGRLEAENAQLRAEIAELRKDRERLVIAASAVLIANRQLCVSHPQFTWKCLDHLDAAIAAAESKGEK